jgi:Domain of unknown function (DUF4148)
MKAGRFSAILAATWLSTAAIAQDAPAVGGKSRAEVQQELRNAHHDGTIPAGKHDYPPKASTVARNKEVHRITQHSGEKAPAMDEHDLGKPATVR